jgi:hypothetical protein
LIQANNYAVYALIKGGYNGAALQGLLKAVPKALEMTAITAKKLKERIALLAQATTHRKKFHATGGSHICSDDFFNSLSAMDGHDRPLKN